jgi:hypothetical protein
MKGMVPYAELEKAIKRWKIRQAGGEPAANDNAPAPDVHAAAAWSSADAHVPVEDGQVQEVHHHDDMESSGLSFVDIETDPGVRPVLRDRGDQK